MLPKHADREAILELLHEEGGLEPGVATRIHRKTGVPEADIYGVATFYSLIAEPEAGGHALRDLALLERDVAFEARAVDERANGAACAGRRAAAARHHCPGR